MILSSAPSSSHSQLPIDLGLEDLEEAAQQLLQALLLRHKYISSSLQSFFPTTHRFLSDIYQDSEIAAELNRESLCPNLMWLTSQQSKDKGTLNGMKFLFFHHFNTIAFRNR